MAPSIGSMPWLDQENQQVAQFAAQEAEDFAFAVRNELDFLNEHMAEIFSKNQVNITEIFKTPGKLRGKTPRTARKRNPLEIREPLNDVFAPNAQSRTSPIRSTSPAKEQRHFQVAKDAIVPEVDRDTKLKNDSGYHGMTEDEMDIDEQATSAKPRTPGLEAKVGLLEAHKPRLSRELSAFDGSFHSAKEDLTWEASKEPGGRRVKGTVSPQAQAPKAIRSTDGLSSPQMVQTEKSDDCAMETEPAEKASLMDEDVGNDSLRSPSEGSSPGLKSLVRKSSLTFATLPAREPLTTKKSTGARLSRTSHLDVMSRGSFLGRITGGKSLGGSRQPVTAAEPHDDDDVDVGGIQQSSGGHEESDSEAEAAKLHNKSSTQRLHDRINMLVQSQPARPKKSIPTAAAPSQPVYPELPTPPTMNDNAQTSSREDEEDDDWIQPPSPRTKPSPRPQLSKSISADVMENLRGKTNISDEQFGRTINEQQPSPRRHSLDSERDSSNVATSGQAATGASESPFKAVRANEEILSTTPLGTPVTARHVDGPISASKSKLQSIMKTARGLFTSSAGASAQAKMELRNQAELGSPKIPAPSKSTPKEVVTVLYPCLPLGQKNNATYGARPENPAKPPEGRRTRGSIEKEKKEKERQQIDEELEKRRDENLLSQRQSQRDQNLAYDEHDGPTPPPKPQQQPTKKSPRRLQTQQTAAPAPENIGENTQNTASVKGSQPPTSQRSQLQKPRDVRRAVKPAKETAPKPEPQRVAIRVGTLTLRNPLSNAALSAGLQDPALPPSDTQPNLAKKTSTVSLQTSASNSSLKSTTTSKPKALIAAEKKKEQDERETQRKLEQKREIERKRTAQQEEVRRQEQAQRAEAEKQRERDRAIAAEDPKKIASRQAIEKRRQELARKEQQRAVSASQQQPPPPSRPELGGARPASKLQTVQDHNRPLANHRASNSVKAPIKRAFEPEVDEPVRQPRPPGTQLYQANEAKRRRTNEEAPDEPAVRPTMAPPKRQSNLLKDALRPYGPSLMGPPGSTVNGYSHAKPGMINHTYQVPYQQQAQPPRAGQAPQDMAKYANGRIVFAENSNPAYPSHKTPNQSRLTNQQALGKSSPQYVNGENIQLEDIPTDAEDSDDESDQKAKGAMLPSWVQSPVLNELLREQEKNTDPDSIFGPSAAVNMEEMFKERHHRFRSRTSSANWAGNDRLTEEEIRQDNAAREKMRREGGWTFGL